MKSPVNLYLVDRKANCPPHKTIALVHVIIAEIDSIKYGTPLYENKELLDKDLFRLVVLYGRNVASYKFALKPNSTYSLERMLSVCFCK